MAPKHEDGFVLTISDNEDGVPGLAEEEGEEEDDGVEFSSLPNRASKKRKRAADEPTTNGNSSKKSKKSKKMAKEDEHDLARSAEDQDHDWAADGKDDGAMDPEFEFQVGDANTGVLEDFDGWGLGAGKAGQKSGDKKGVDIDEIIARRKKKENATHQLNGDSLDSEEALDESVSDGDGFTGFDGADDELLAEDGFGMGATGEDEEDVSHGGSDGDSGSSDNEEEASEDSEVAAPVPHPDDVASQASSDDEREDPAEVERRAAFFAPEENTDGSKPPSTATSGSFQNMQLSRPILKGLAAVGFTEPTPIQSKTIPVASSGKDVVGGAVTGSGKTAAFIIPILERLLYRQRKVPTTRAAILMPTRELAVQCFNVAKKLASFTDITFAQIVGGFSLREQEQVLKTRPDVVIATPGRFIDHMRNSPSFTVDTLEILVLDEADRMLEDGFADELNEILTTIPKSRQTMLFSATMTDSVDKLIRVGLNRPVRLLVDAKRQTVQGLVQEFVRLRPGREGKRLGYLMYLCQNVYTDRVIVFFRQKKEAHRVRIGFGLCGLKAAELHGGMSQEQRIASVEAFRSNRVSYLLATDLASRGLDIKGVETVVNYEAPQSHEIYLHRVGRTARAGRSGRSCTIAAEPDRKVVKAAVRAARAQGAVVKQRTVEPRDADAWAEKVAKLEDDIGAVLQEEKDERQLASMDMQVRRADNIIVHEAEIKARPKRTWFESEADKRTAKASGKAELNGPDAAIGKTERKKLSGKEKKKLLDRDDRVGGRSWKKGAAERAGKGALAKAKEAKNAKKAEKRGKGKADAKVGTKGKGKR